MLLVLAVVALVAVAAVVVVVRRDSNTYRWPWNAVEALPGNRLRVEYGRPSPCDRFERVDVRETDEEVTVTLFLVDRSGGEGCLAVVEFGATEVRLRRPLGSRAVVNGGCSAGHTGDWCERPTIRRH